MKTLETLLVVGGCIHFAILTASALTPHVLDWRKNLAPLPSFLRRLFWVYGAFIVLTIIGFGTLTLMHVHAMASGDPLARRLCGFIALFWLARFVVQLWVFDATPFLITRLMRFGYHALTVAFVYLAAVFGYAALFF